MSALEKSSVRHLMRGYAIVPMVTPVGLTGKLDPGAITRLIDHILGGGCQALMVGGTNGEGPSLAATDRIELVRLARFAARGRARLIASISGTALVDAVRAGRESLAAGADAIAAHPAPYFQVEAEELEVYFTRLADETGGPLFLYNMPLTTRISIPLEVVERLSHHPAIVGIKDSEGNRDRQVALAEKFKGRKDFAVFCGAASHASAAMQAGADGCVPSLGNLAPAFCRGWMDSAVAAETALDDLQSQANTLAAIYQTGRPLHRQVPALKACSELLGHASRHVLSPLLPTPEDEIPAMAEVLRQHGLLHEV